MQEKKDTQMVLASSSFENATGEIKRLKVFKECDSSQFAIC